MTKVVMKYTFSLLTSTNRATQNKRPEAQKDVTSLRSLGNNLPYCFCITVSVHYV